jgi:eukaryotic-like serine/threonine-protein kinase
MSRVSEPTRIGRFQILRTLGRGGQGEVYLAEDTQLKRRVAIKTLTLDGVPSDERPARVKSLLDEALIVGQLSHPNIVPLYDAGLDGETPWLVFEYVEGKTLSATIKEGGAIAPLRAVDIAIQILKAIGFAHSKRVVHRDVKPANVMIDGETARVMDFGIAEAIQKQPSPDAPFVGSPAYMAPEYIGGKPYTERSDLFAVGMTLYEMVTGKPAVTGKDPYQILHQVANQPFAPPSQVNSEVDERLDDLILKALAKDPLARFESAAAMEDALLRYVSPEPVTAEGSQGTLDFLLRRMRYKSDFPALSSTMGAVNRSAASETERVAQLSNSILKDFALTNKLLKLVNSASYSQYGGSISTVSRAVVIMGFDNVRNVAITLMLFEHLQNKAQAARLRDEILATYFSGLLARELARKAGVRHAEEAFICSMFHKLGRLLTAFYFHEEFQEIQKRCQNAGLDEEQAAAQVLGISFEELGLGVAKAWHFPERIVDTLRRVTDERVRKPQNDEQRLRILAELASATTDCMRDTDPARRRSRLAALATQFGEGLGVSETVLIDATKSAAQALSVDSGLLNFTPAQSGLYAALRDWSRPQAQQSGEAQPVNTLESMLAETTLVQTAPQSASAAPASLDSQAILTAGIQDITNTLVGTYQLNDLLRMILETMYRGMGFTRVLLCVRDPAHNALRGRFGFGQDIDQVIKRGFSVSLAPTRDAFYAAVSQGADVFIEDVNGEKIREHIPEWYRKLVPARSLVLFPVMINKKPVGLFYADCDAVRHIQLGSAELSLLKTLRNQAVLAIKQNS